MKVHGRVPQRVRGRVTETLFSTTATQPHLATQPQRTSTQRTGTFNSGPAGGLNDSMPQPFNLRNRNGLRRGAIAVDDRALRVGKENR